jgi:DNA-binding MarR family transcriptional regulator
MLNYLLGATEGLVMYSIYLDYANKLQDIGTGKGFDINEDGYVPKSYNTIADFTGLEYDTVRRCVDRLIKKGLLQKKPGNKENKNIPYYLPVLESSVFINLAKEKLVDKRNARDEKNKNQAERLIPQIIETLENDSHVLVALGLVNRTRLEEFLDELNPTKKVTDTEEIQETNSQETNPQKTPPQKTPLDVDKNNRDPFKVLNLVRRAN